MAYFTASAGQTAQVSMVRLSATDLDPHITLYGPSGAQLNYNYGTTSATLSQALTQTGTYAVRCLDAYGTGTGTYSFVVSLTP